MAKLSEQSFIYSAKEAVEVLEGNELVIESAIPLVGNRKKVTTFPQIRKRHFKVCYFLIKDIVTYSFNDVTLLSVLL